MAKKVAVIMGSDSDLPVVKKAIDKLKAFGIPVEAHVMSAHRTPAAAAEFSALLAALREMSVPDEPDPVKIDWNC